MVLCVKTTSWAKQSEWRDGRPSADEHNKIKVVVYCCYPPIHRIKTPIHVQGNYGNIISAQSLSKLPPARHLPSKYQRVLCYFCKAQSAVLVRKQGRSDFNPSTPCSCVAMILDLRDKRIFSSVASHYTVGLPT